MLVCIWEVVITSYYMILVDLICPPKEYHREVVVLSREVTLI